MRSQNVWHHHQDGCDSQTQLIKYSSPLETSHLNCCCLKNQVLEPSPALTDATLGLPLRPWHRAGQAKQLISSHAELPAWFPAFTYTKNSITLSLAHTDGKTLLCTHSIHTYSSQAWHSLVLRDGFQQKYIHPDTQDVLLLLNQPAAMFYIPNAIKITKDSWLISDQLLHQCNTTDLES